MELRKGSGLEEGIRYPVRQKTIAGAFEPFDKLSCRFGSSAFLLDSRCVARPVISGVVVASVNFSRMRKGILQVYPVAEEVFAMAAMKEFESAVVPYLVLWLKGQLAKPEGAVAGHEQLIVSWDGLKFGYVQVKFE
jgi:hypothetical protein